MSYHPFWHHGKHFSLCKQRRDKNQQTLPLLFVLKKANSIVGTSFSSFSHLTPNANALEISRERKVASCLALSRQHFHIKIFSQLAQGVTNLVIDSSAAASSIECVRVFCLLFPDAAATKVKRPSVHTLETQRGGPSSIQPLAHTARRETAFQDRSPREQHTVCWHDITQEHGKAQVLYQSRSLAGIPMIGSSGAGNGAREYCRDKCAHGNNARRINPHCSSNRTTHLALMHSLAAPILAPRVHAWFASGLNVEKQC